MSEQRKRWLAAAAVVACVYLVAGFGLGALAGSAGSERMRFAWRLAAFVVSGVAFLAQVLYEGIRLRLPARATAWHAAAAVALAALALAVAANLHPHAAEVAARLRISLVVWPLMAALPLAAIAWIVAGGLTRARR